MKLSIALIAAVSARRLGGKHMDSGRHMDSGSPVAEWDESGSGRSGSPKSGHADDSYHFDKEMHEEYNELNKMMGMMGGDTNAMNINFAPINNNNQNFIDIDTDVNTNLGFAWGKKGYDKYDKGDKWDKDDKEDKWDDKWDWDKDWESEKEWNGFKGMIEMIKEEYGSEMIEMVQKKMMYMLMEKAEMIREYLPYYQAAMEEFTGYSCAELKEGFDYVFIQGNICHEEVEMEVRQWMKETYTWEKLSKLMMDLGIDCKLVMKKMYMKYNLMKDLMAHMAEEDVPQDLDNVVDPIDIVVTDPDQFDDAVALIAENQDDDQDQGNDDMAIIGEEDQLDIDVELFARKADRYMSFMLDYSMDCIVDKMCTVHHY